MYYISDYLLREKGYKFIYGKRANGENNFHYAVKRSNDNTLKQRHLNLQ